MSPSIIIDTNPGEGALHANLLAKFGDAVVARKRLDVGDVHLDVNGTLVLIERKTWADLAKSLTDGRWHEQKARLIAMANGTEEQEDGTTSASDGRPRPTILYLVEGPIRGWFGKVGGSMGATSKVTNARLEAALIKTTVRDGFGVIRTANTAHTAEVCAYLYESLRNGERFSGFAATAGDGDYVSLYRVRKRDNLDATTTFRAMLSVVPGMSAQKARAVATRR